MKADQTIGFSRVIHGLRHNAYLTAADHKNILPSDLPCQNQRAASLNLWKVSGHGREMAVMSIATLRELDPSPVAAYR